MWSQLYEWAALFIKWFHVICAMAWIGASFYFSWLDNSLESPPKWKKDKGIKGDLWAIHGGGFYEVSKYQTGPKKIPNKLHWFKWEAYTTWITGTLLIILMYYLNAQSYLIDPRVMNLTPVQAVSIGILAIICGVVAYEGVLRSPMTKNRIIFCSSIIAIGAIFFYGFSNLFSGRGAFIHMGALIGTIMACNVFFIIIPNQRKMVNQISAGEDVDPRPGLDGKRRSIHNNYFTLPVIFLMISNHYPVVYQHPNNWFIGLLILVISAYIRHYFNLKHAGKHKPQVLILGVTAMFVLAAAMIFPLNKSNSLTVDKVNVEVFTDKRLTLNKDQLKVQKIIKNRCSQCHSSSPTDDIFTVAPSGAVFDDWQDIVRWRPRILVRSVETVDMPFLNKTKMTEMERQTLKELLSN